MINLTTKKMKDLFTDQELKDILSDLKPIEIPMGDDEIHREELYWTIGCIEIYADVICVRKTIHDSDTYEEYLFEIDEMSIYCDSDECSTYNQRDKVVIPILNDLITIY